MVAGGAGEDVYPRAGPHVRGEAAKVPSAGRKGAGHHQRGASHGAGRDGDNPLGQRCVVGFLLGLSRGGVGNFYGVTRFSPFARGVEEERKGGLFMGLLAGGRAHLLLALVIRTLTAHPF